MWTGNVVVASTMEDLLDLSEQQSSTNSLQEGAYSEHDIYHRTLVPDIRHNQPWRKCLTIQAFADSLQQPITGERLGQEILALAPTKLSPRLIGFAAAGEDHFKIRSVGSQNLGQTLPAHPRRHHQVGKEQIHGIAMGTPYFDG